MATPSASAIQYNSPYWGVATGSTTAGDHAVQVNKSSVGDQIRLDIFIKQAIEDKAKDTIFTQLSNVMGLPKNSGKTIKKHRYIPILDDRNINGQGIDSNGTSQGATNPVGNLFGSATDVGLIEKGLPTLSEAGGRVNRVGITRQVLESSLHNLGFFLEFTRDSLDFDDDSMLFSHLAKESLHAAMEINEKLLCIDLMKQGQQVFSGGATSLNTMTAETASAVSEITYSDLLRMAVTLKRNQAPVNIKACTGTRLVDTKTIPNAYAMIIGYEMENHFRLMRHEGEKVFIPVEKYAVGTETLHGEIGSVGQFRIIVAPQMTSYGAAGVEATTAQKNIYRNHKGYTGNPTGQVDTSKSYYSAFPCMAMSAEAYTALSFRSGGAGSKMPFEMMTKMPGKEAMSLADPYGKLGLHSVQFWYGLLMERPEWVITQYSVAKY